MPKKPPKETKTHTVARDSKSGRFVTNEYGKANPKTTVRESIPNPGRGDTGRGDKK